MAFFQRLSLPTMSEPPQEQSKASSSEASDSTSLTSPRSLKQLTLFLAGSTFFAFSTLITRRALVRRYASTVPRTFTPSNRPSPRTANGAFEAFEALNIATINVASFSMMMTGGTLWALDISSMDDLRKKVRGGLGVDGTGRSEREAEEEWEEWLAETLARKEEKRRRRGTEEAETRNEEG